MRHIFLNAAHNCCVRQCRWQPVHQPKLYLINILLLDLMRSAIAFRELYCLLPETSVEGKTRLQAGAIISLYFCRKCGTDSGKSLLNVPSFVQRSPQR